MFVGIFVYTILVLHVAAEMPSYFHGCGRNDPNYNQCIADNIISVKNKICTGFPEFNSPPNEPIIIYDKIVIFDTDSIKLHIKDIKVYGICDFDINSVRTDPERLHFDFDILFRHLYFNSTYNFEIRLLVPIVHQGLIDVFTDNIRMKISLDLKMIIRNNKKHIFASKVNTNTDITEFKYKFHENNKEFVEIFSNVINNGKQEIINSVKPVIEEVFSKIVISFFNNIARSNYEKLFPENT